MTRQDLYLIIWRVVHQGLTDIHGWLVVLVGYGIRLGGGYRDEYSTSPFLSSSLLTIPPTTLPLPYPISEISGLQELFIDRIILNESDT